MLEEKSLPKFYWAEAVRTAVYIQNRIRDKVLAHELYFRTKPNLRHLRVFDRIAYAEKCILVGYSDEQKGYKCYNPSTKQACVSRDIVFHESASWYLPPTPDLNSNPSSDSPTNASATPKIAVTGLQRRSPHRPRRPRHRLMNDYADLPARRTLLCGLDTTSIWRIIMRT